MPAVGNQVANARPACRASANTRDVPGLSRGPGLNPGRPNGGARRPSRLPHNVAAGCQTPGHDQRHAAVQGASVGSSLRCPSGPWRPCCSVPAQRPQPPFLQPKLASGPSALRSPRLSGSRSTSPQVITGFVPRRSCRSWWVTVLPQKPLRAPVTTSCSVCAQTGLKRRLPRSVAERCLMIRIGWRLCIVVLAIRRRR